MTTKEKLLQAIAQSPEALLQELLGFLVFTKNTRYTQPQKPIWQVAQEIMADVPDEVLNQLPIDGAAQHDHYIHGIPNTKSSPDSIANGNTQKSKRQVNCEIESLKAWFEKTEPAPPDFDPDLAKWEYLKEKHNL